MQNSPGQRFRQALASNHPLPVVGTINAYCALMAKKIGHHAIYLAGGGLATHTYGQPDLAITNLSDVLSEVRKITDACDLPLMVDVDTGFGGHFNIKRLVQGLIKDGAASMHIEDQVALKRCGHRPGKSIVPINEMLDRVKASVDARTDASFFIIARTDAIAVEGIDRAIERSKKYLEAGADMIFAEACHTLDDYEKFVKALDRPHSVIANITEFSLTPTFSMSQLGEVGVSAALFPLSAARAMAAAAVKVYSEILQNGSPKNLLGEMQTLEELYEFLDYYAHEKKLYELYK